MNWNSNNNFGIKFKYKTEQNIKVWWKKCVKQCEVSCFCGETKTKNYSIKKVINSKKKSLIFKTQKKNI